jgi:hypothetical protein
VNRPFLLFSTLKVTFSDSPIRSSVFETLTEHSGVFWATDIETIAAIQVSIRLNFRITLDFLIVKRCNKRPEKHQPGGFVQRTRLAL